MKFGEDILKHVAGNSKYWEVALVCLLDMCRAATHVTVDGEVPLRMLAYDIAHEIKVRLFISTHYMIFIPARLHFRQIQLESHFGNLRRKSTYLFMQRLWSRFTGFCQKKMRYHYFLSAPNRSDRRRSKRVVFGPV